MDINKNLLFNKIKQYATISIISLLLSFGGSLLLTYSISVNQTRNAVGTIDWDNSYVFGVKNADGRFQGQVFDPQGKTMSYIGFDKFDVNGKNVNFVIEHPVVEKIGVGMVVFGFALQLFEEIKKRKKEIM